MLNLTPYQENPFCFYKKILKNKRGVSELELINDEIQSLFSCYSQKFNDNTLCELISSSKINSTQKEVLKLLYSSQNKLLKELRRGLIYGSNNRIFNTCQYCTLNEISGLDHFVPKSEFPEFSVNPQNLFPCCSICNTLKGEKWRDSESSIFLNLYLDDLPQESYLEAKIIDIVDGIPSIVFQIQNDNISSKLLTVIKKHYKNLNLMKRFLDYSNDIITDFVQDIVSYKDSLTKEQIKEITLKKCYDERMYYGYNYWQTVIKESLILNDDFLDYHFCK